MHTDVCDPMQVNSVGGNRYFVSFIDNFNRNAHVYFLRDKYVVFHVFKEYEVLVTNQTCLTIGGALRIDGGGEYTSNEFERYLTSKIHPSLSTAK